MSAPLQVRERPILFSDEMVRALRDGRKTQTRRVMNPQPSGHPVIYSPEVEGGPLFSGLATWAVWMTDRVNEHGEHVEHGARCPYGRPGDRLYVKESAWMWCERRPNGTTPSGRPKWLHVPMQGAPVHYAADGGGKPGTPDTGDGCGWRFKVARFLPRWASRLTLEITEVRVERVRDISESDVFAEGVQIPVSEESGALLLRLAGEKGPSPAAYLKRGYTQEEFVRAHFAALWDGINAARGYDWAANPWVWCLSFRVLDGEVRS